MTVLKVLKDSVWISKQRKNLNPVFDSAFEVQMVSVGDCAFVVSRIASVWVDRNDFNVDFRNVIVCAVVIAFVSSSVVLVGLPVDVCPASVSGLIVSWVLSAGCSVVMSSCVEVTSAVSVILPGCPVAKWPTFVVGSTVSWISSEGFLLSI